MSSIYGTLRNYSPSVSAKKLEQLKYRGDISVLDTQQTAVSVISDGHLYNHTKADAVVNLYKQYGINCLQYMNGDFAFVLFDPHTNQLFGAVDRVGAKPLYYSLQGGFEFCSCLLPLCIGNNYSVDPYARQCYFAMQYVPAPYSMVEQVRKLGAGEYFVYDIEKGKLSISQYWDLYSNSCGFIEPKCRAEAIDTCQTLLDDAVKLRLETGKSEGVFLSGGIDSSTIAKFATKHGNHIEGFSVGFEESEFDESEYARMVAERYGIHFNHLLCTTKEAIDVISGLQQYYDEPMGDYSSIPTSLLCEKTGMVVNTALGGDGGDEMFFGYPRYLRYAGREATYKIPMSVRRIASKAVRIAGKKRLADSLLLKDVQQLYLNRRPSNSAELFNAFEVQQSIPQTKYLYGNKDLRRAFNDFDIKSLMTYGYNVKLDRAAVRGRLDVRTPMLDYRIVEYSRLLPIDYCYNRKIGQKSILREILYEDFDRSFFDRRKQGFGVPLGAWFRGGLRDYLCDTLNEQSVENLPDYDPQLLIQVRDRHIADVEDQATLLWLCVNYLEWHKLFQHCQK